MVFIVREITKLLMFVLLWGIPVLLSYINQNNNYLWFFVVSAIFTGFLFSHYEDLEKIDNKSSNCKCSRNE